MPSTNIIAQPLNSKSNDPSLQISDSNSPAVDANPANLIRSPSEFRILKTIGSGSFGSVCKARSNSDKKIYAIKKIPKYDMEGRTQEKLIMNEIDLLIELNHPSIIQCSGYYIKNFVFHIVLELADEGDLREKLGRKAFPENLARSYILEVANALEYLHQKQIIHRDVKLSNVLLTSDHQIKLADFGLASKAPSGFASGNYGTPYIKAPEVINGDEYTKCIDWWALGVMLYEMVTCKEPFQEVGTQTLEESIKHEKVEIPKTISPECSEVICRLLEKDPDQRLNSLAELLNTDFFKKDIKLP